MNTLEKIELDKIKITLTGVINTIDSIPIRQKQPLVVLLREDRINYVLDNICEYYKITREILIKRYRNPRFANRKKLTVKLLRDIADIPVIDIAESLGFVSYDAIYDIYRNITEDLQESSYGNKELKQEYKDILKQLNL
jgi:chromosomal replication initiation ATPase DnaA